MSYNESHVRRWIKDLYGNSAEWIEQAPGGTVGVPDVLLPFGGLRYPVECKFWALRKDGKLAARIRPSQIVYHARSSGRGDLSALLVGWEQRGNLVVGLIPGHRAPTTAASLVDPPPIIPKDLEVFQAALIGPGFYPPPRKVESATGDRHSALPRLVTPA